jgi:MFS family permease
VAADAEHDVVGQRGPRRTRRLLQLTTLVSTLDRFAMAPMLVAIAADLDVPLGQVVGAAGVYFLTYGLMQPVWGLLSDRIGLVRTLRLTLAVGAVATAVSTLAWSVLALAVARGLAGSFFAAAVPSTLVYVGDTVPARHRQRDVTDLMAGVAIGTGIAAASAGIIADHLSWRLVFVVTGLAAAALSVALRDLEEPAVERQRGSLLAPLGAVLRNRSARLVLALAVAEGVVLLGLLTLLPTSLEHGGASASVAGVVTATFAVAVLVGAQATGRLSRRVPASRLLAFGASGALLACLVAAASSTVAAGVAVALLLGIAWSSMHSTVQTWATQVFPEQRAATVSLFAGSLFAGSALGTLLLGGLAEDGRFGAAFLALGVVTVPLGVVGSVALARWEAT